MIYIDLGCHNADTIKEFHEGKFHNIYPDTIKSPNLKFNSIGIDPLTKYQKEWDKITDKYGTLFFNCAAWDEKGWLDFSEKEQDIKSSVMKSKVSYAGGKIRKVKSMDFSTFVKNLKDFVIIRMDIEGAEYNVLNKMIKDGTINKVKFLEVEWHSQKMTKDYYKVQQQEIKNKLTELNILYAEIK